MISGDAMPNSQIGKKASIVQSLILYIFPVSKFELVPTRHQTHNRR